MVAWRQATIADAIRAGAPRFAGADMLSSVVPMPGKSKRAK
jgi:hypothetical protein